MLTQSLNGVGALATRFDRLASFCTSETFAWDTWAVPTAYWSAPWSAIRRLVWSLRFGEKSNTQLSGYWCRIGSDAGSQLGFFFSFSLVWPSYGPSCMYGPVESHARSYAAPVSLAAGTGVVVLSAIRYAHSGCVSLRLKTIVLSSGV